MVIINRKRILFIIMFLVISIATYTISIPNQKNSIATSSLPVTNKVIVLDAGHGKPDEGAESSNRNNRSTNKFKNCNKSAKFIRAKRCNSYINKK